MHIIGSSPFLCLRFRMSGSVNHLDLSFSYLLFFLGAAVGLASSRLSVARLALSVQLDILLVLALTVFIL